MSLERLFDLQKKEMIMLDMSNIRWLNSLNVKERCRRRLLKHVALQRQELTAGLHLSNVNVRKMTFRHF